MRATPNAGDPVLRAVDRSLLTAIPLVILSIVIVRPDIAVAWIAIGAVMLAVVAGCARFGGPRFARWRGIVYAAILLLGAIGGLWTVGPFTGVGCAFGLSILFAGAFLPRRWLVGVTGLALGAIAVRTAEGPDAYAAAAIVVDLKLWIATALVCWAAMWIALETLTALLASLELAYVTAVAAYHDEVAGRDQLEGSRHELEELYQVEMVGRLAGGVAHDVNNALAVIIGASEMLAHDVVTPAQQRAVAELDAASQHAAELVRDLLWTGRRFPMSSSAVADVSVTMRRCLERLGRVARAIVVEGCLPAGLRVAMSPEHLEQILFGLVLGADRAGVRGLRWTARALPGYVEISLSGSCERPPVAGRRGMQLELGVAAARELLGDGGGSIDTSGQATVLRLPSVAP